MKGYFGKYGGAFVSNEVKKALNELEEAFEKAIEDKEFMREYNYYLKDYSGRETPLYFAENLTKFCGGPKVYLKREDLNHTGAHKINNVLGQILLAKRMGKNKVIAETGAGQHGVATATLAAKFGMECEIVMGEEDIKRQELNVFRMKILGAKITPATSGTKTLNDAVNEALEKWVKNISDTFYVLGSAVGPHPYPKIVKEFQKIIGEEARKQILEKENKLPNHVVACVGGGSNAIGIFTAFLEDKDVNLIGVEAAGFGVETEMHAATITKGKEAIIHGMNTLVLKDDSGDIKEAYSISPGLDYPGVGPEHAFLSEIGRANYKYITDDEAIKAFMLLSKLEGIIPAIESAHAIAYTIKLAKTLQKNEVIVVNLSGRGDKDVSAINKLLN
ncbi:tryptophan synthase subunit beta [Clostridium sulfidigenes]|uniref:Tryptophan synthase beta chain n=1 Tax=Clostridium sulfidigenes TaxID=318464 RepID=A0A084JAV9_9CLOT|nr:tryptophan synthase subunit beta [Clostridium sulfidigenes]KEZ86093.1 tryptophan synthase subunit beta [Clostridium sulfidigenes]